MQAEKKLVPKNRVGAKTGATHKKEKPTRHEAILLFKEAKIRLLDINNWSKLCGKGSAKFQICNEKGQPVYAMQPKIGDVIRISLPAPPNNGGDGYDWVRVEEFVNTLDLIKDEEVFGFRVRPVQNPQGSGGESAHFYTSDATSTFMVIRTTNRVTALERGRNERPNVRPGRFLNKVRNAVIALAAMLGLSTPQWKSLVNGILNGPAEDK